MFRNHNANYEQQSKFIQDRISSVERNFSELCSVFGDYTRKTARLRDMGDEVAKTIKNYADTEKVNKSLSNGLSNLSLTLSAIEEYRNVEVQRLETKVIGELAQYETICKHAREELKHTISARDRELSRRKVLDRVRERQPGNRHHISYAESELLKASAELSRTAKTLTEQTEFFERKKLEQLKALFGDFIKTEMIFHAKALELLTVAFQQVKDINEKADLESAGLTIHKDPILPKNFRKKLKSPEKSNYPQLTARSTSLGSLLNQNVSNRRNYSSDSGDDEEGNNSQDTESNSSSSNSE